MIGWNKYPYLDLHDLNLDWILEVIKQLDGEMDEFTALNKITFDGEWDITKQYPAWCIVNTNGGTQGYISIKPVPAGVVITNTDYWAGVVDYTATIADLQNRVIALENTVGDNSSGLVKSVNDLTSDLSDLTAEVGTKQTKVFHKAIIVGDSWAVGYYAGAGHPGEGWGDYACPLLGITDPTNILTVASGGSGFCNGTGEHFDLQIKRAYNDYPAFRDADLILCVGGFNDAQDHRSFSELQTAAGSFFSNCKSYFPNAETHVFPLQLPYGAASAMDGYRWGVLSGIKQGFYDQTSGNLFLHDGIRRWANAFGAGASAGDGSHLNQYGYKYMGQLIAMCVRKNSDYYPTLRGTCDTSALGAHLVSTITNQVTEDNGMLFISLCIEVSNWSAEYITLPDIGQVRGNSYFFNGSDLMVWNANGIKPNTAAITGIVTVCLTIPAGR